MIGMKSNPQQDLQSLESAKMAPSPIPQQAMPMPNMMPPTGMPNPLQGGQQLPAGPMPSPQMGQVPQAGQAPNGWDPVTYQNFKQANPSLEPNSEDTQHMLDADRPSGAGQVVKNAVRKAAGTSAKAGANALAPGVSSAVGAAAKAPAGMKWLLDYMQKRHSDHLDHERQILQQVLQHAKDRGGAAPDSMKGHEQDYYDQTKNTGHTL